MLLNSFFFLRIFEHSDLGAHLRISQQPSRQAVRFQQCFLNGVRDLCRVMGEAVLAEFPLGSVREFPSPRFQIPAVLRAPSNQLTTEVASVCETA